MIARDTSYVVIDVNVLTLAAGDPKSPQASESCHATVAHIGGSYIHAGKRGGLVVQKARQLPSQLGSQFSEVLICLAEVRGYRCASCGKMLITSTLLGFEKLSKRR